jgi:hypothetical protein
MYCWWDCKLVKLLWKSVLRFLIKLKIDLQYDPAIPLWGIYLKESKSIYQRDNYISMFSGALFTIAKLWKQLKYPTTEKWLKNLYVCAHVCVCVCVCVFVWLHTHHGIFFSQKENLCHFVENG